MSCISLFTQSFRDNKSIFSTVISYADINSLQARFYTIAIALAEESSAGKIAQFSDVRFNERADM